MLALFLVASLVGPVGAAQAAIGTGRIDLKVLVVNDGSPAVLALMAEMDREGVPYDKVTPTAGTDITPGLLSDTGSATPHGRYQAIVLPNSAPLDIDATEMATLVSYERAYGVRQVNAYLFPTAEDGLVNQWSGPLDGKTATVTTAGLAGPFSYLKGNVPLDNFDPIVDEVYGFLPLPVTPQPAGQSFQPLLTVPIPAGAPNAGQLGSIIGVQSDNGREEMIITAAFNEHQQWLQTVGHGIITWMTRGVHLGYDRNYFSVDVDDVFMADGRWSATGHCTPGDEQCGATTTDIRMVPADVDKLVTWQGANAFKLNMVFNGGGSDLWKLDQVPPLELTAADPLVDKFVAPTTAANFDWINHTFTHPFLGCIQISAAVVGQPWHCATTAAEEPRQDPTIEEQGPSGGLFWMSQAAITAQIGDNIAWANLHALPNFTSSELVTGEHSGLKALPWQAVDSPFLGPALTANGIAYTASDHSREPDQRVVTGAGTRTVPRHPMNIYYNAGTFLDEVSEYNWIYTSAADGGSGICTANPATSTCITPLAAGDNAAAQASFNGYIKPLEVRIALSHVLTNDPAPHYAHQSNIAEDGILYPVLEGVLAGYRAMFADNAPIVKPTMTQSGIQFGRAAAWSAAKGSTTAYLDSTGVHVTPATGTQVPVTVPTGSAGGSLEAYAGELSGWNAGPVNITVPDVGYGTASVAPTLVSGIAGDKKVTLSWTAPVVPAGAPVIASYIVTPYIGATAQPPVTTSTPALTFDVSGLTNGTAYTFTVAAKNTNGFASPPSAASAAVTPVGTPGAPTAVTGTAGDKEVALRWTEPNNAGNSPVTGYEIVPYLGTAAQPAIPVNSNATAHTVTGLTNGTTYTFTVAAKNALGTGAASAKSATMKPVPVPVPVPVPPPGNAPTVSLVRVNPLTLASSVTYRWRATTNGPAITSYQVYVRRAAFGKSLPPTWKLLRTVKASTTQVSFGRGETVVVAVKPVDQASKATQLSAASTPVSLPLGVGSMVKSKGWKKVSNKAYYGSAALQISRRGATLKLPTVTRASRVALIASSGRGNGVVDIVVGGKTVRSVNLSTRTASTKLIFLPTAFTARSGAVVLRVRTSGKLVRIQGFAVLR